MSGAPARASPCAAHACAECCWDTEMPVLEEDVRRLEALGHSRDDFTRREAGGLLLRTRDEPRADGKRPCFFLRDERCSVYGDRPVGCRIYPFILTPEGRMVRDDECPHRREFSAENGLQRRLQRVVAAWSHERR